MKQKRSVSTTNLRKTSPKPKTPTKNQIQPDNNFYYTTNASKPEDLYVKKWKSLIAQPSLDLLISQLYQSRQRLLPEMQVYDLLKEGNLPPRCLQHNNIISLYCLHQRRLLCVNCVYGNQKHRTHKVNPVKDCVSQVQKDNRKLQEQVIKQFNRLKEQQQISNHNIKQMEDTLQELLVTLEQQFDAISRSLTAKYLQIKTSLIQNFHEVIEKNRVIYQQFVWMTDMMDLTLNKIHIHRDDQELLRGHMLMLKVLQLSGLKTKRYKKQETINSSKQIFKQLKKIRQNLQKGKLR